MAGGGGMYMPVGMGTTTLLWDFPGFPGFPSVLPLPLSLPLLLLLLLPLPLPLPLPTPPVPVLLLLPPLPVPLLDPLLLSTFDFIATNVEPRDPIVAMLELVADIVVDDSLLSNTLSIIRSAVCRSVSVAFINQRGSNAEQNASTCVYNSGRVFFS